MVRIRLRRTGAKKAPMYRIVVADQEAPRDGKFIESIGQYNPRTNPETVLVDESRALYWLKVGAQPTESVLKLFTKRGTMNRFERLRQGEAVDALLVEAEETNKTARTISPQTRQAGLAGKKKAKAAKKAEAAPAA
ncbi:MAG TPA: 30S ribosomal protein S16 [Anaerolineae bacterium]